MTMVGQVIHRGAVIHGQTEPFLAIVWTQLRSFVRNAIGSNYAH